MTAYVASSATKAGPLFALSGGDTLLVGAGVQVVASSGVAVVGGGAFQVTIDGLLAAQDTSANVIYGPIASAVKIDASGSVQGSVFAGTVDNSGAVSGTGDYAVSAYGGLINSGSITDTAIGGQAAVSVDHGGLVNTGAITSVNTTAVSVRGGAVENAGLIRSDHATFAMQSSEALTLVNDPSGVIIGGLSASPDADHVNNNGRIQGDVQLGDGDDQLDDRGGSVSGVISGGAGADTLYAGVNGDRLEGDQGNDQLVGGQGPDTFAYPDRFFGDDVLTGFHSGDRIDLSGVGVSSLAQLQPFMRQAGADVVITFGYDGASESITLRSVSLQALNDAAFVFNTSTADASVGGTGLHDVLFGGLGDDRLFGGPGDDVLDGGAGVDTAVYSGTASDYSLARAADGALLITDHRGLGATDGTDTLRNIELLQFSDGVFAAPALLDAAVANAFTAVLRIDVVSLATSAFTNTLATLADPDAIKAIVVYARATTSVATLSYQFFTGHTPTAAGMDYLVSPTGPNASNLNSAYYAGFSTENRYINFASNLGKVGEGAAAFQAAYGGLSLADATAKAYAAIFGSAPGADKVGHLLHDAVPNGLGGSYEREDYFASYGGDGLSGLGTKAAMVGWLLGQAAAADVGTFALANDAFLADVATGKAAFGADLVGAYAKPGYAYAGG